MRCMYTLALFLTVCFVSFAQGEVDPQSIGEVLPSEIEELPSPQAKRVVSLAPNITEIIFAIGKDELLVGRTDWCDFPPEAASVPSVGSITDSSIEMILSLAPDLVLSAPITPQGLRSLLETSGVKTIQFEAQEHYSDTYQLIQEIGDLLHASEEASILVEDMRTRTQRVLAENVELKRPRVYYVVGYGEGGDWTATGDTFMHQLIRLAGGDNIAAELSGWSISLEKLVSGDPDIIVLSEGEGILFSQSPIYSELRAVREGRVFEVNENLFLRQGPRLIDGLELLHSIFQDTSW